MPNIKNPSKKDSYNCDGCLGSGPPFGNTIAKGKSGEVILPNNSNIILTAESVKEQLKDSEVKIHVLKTKSIQQGIAALYNISKEMTPFKDFKEDVIEEFTNSQEGSITYAIRDTELNGVKIKKDQFITIFGKDIIASSNTRLEAFKELIEKINNDDVEEIEVFYNDDISKEELKEIKSILKETGKDFELYFGGQEVYSLLVLGTSV